MDELYRLHSSISFSDHDHDVSGVGDFPTTLSGLHGPVDNMLQFEATEIEVGGSELSDLIKAQIANHPLYPNLVGAPPEMASLLEEISKENHPINSRSDIGADPELDEFMESYCEVLHRYKQELSKPFDEATTFLSDIELQLSNLCKETLTTTTTTTIASGNYHSEWKEREEECNFEERKDGESCDERHQSQKTKQTKKYLKKTQANLNEERKQ
ncbi:hypothetical protein HYC85_017116 [Camellia sinensis]|uniref:KNOX2 domain-containing protein n=1 Tax=Camellia sinensis TaxID=4442 RepID=A0A7J7H583_CAMSI|nr:hypothetical protein HYC85_017116 [Camellia sinensis]